MELYEYLRRYIIIIIIIIIIYYTRRQHNIISPLQKSSKAQEARYRLEPLIVDRNIAYCRLIYKGYQKTVEETDLWKPSPRHVTSSTTPLLEAAWKKEMAKCHRFVVLTS